MLPKTGSISMRQVNEEFKKSPTAVISLNDSNVRKLAERPSGIISMNDLRGKSSVYAGQLTIGGTFSNFSSHGKWSVGYSDDFGKLTPTNLLGGTIVAIHCFGEGYFGEGHSDGEEILRIKKPTKKAKSITIRFYDIERDFLFGETENDTDIYYGQGLTNFFIENLNNVVPITILINE